MAFIIIDFSEFLVFSSVIFLYMNKYFNGFEQRVVTYNLPLSYL